MKARVQVRMTKIEQQVVEVEAKTRQEVDAAVEALFAQREKDGWRVETTVVETDAAPRWSFHVHHFTDDITQPGVLVIYSPDGRRCSDEARTAIVDYAMRNEWHESSWNGHLGADSMSIRTSRALPQVERDALDRFLESIKLSFISLEEWRKEWRKTAGGSAW